MIESAHHLAEVYDMLDNYDKSFEYNELTYKLAMEIQDKENMAKSLNNIGYLYAKIDEYDKNLSDVGSEIKSMNQVFQKVLCLD